MFSRPVCASTTLAARIQSVRTAKRRPAYPRYTAELAPLAHPKKDHSSFFQRHMKAWLGPKNLRGEYYRNKYYYPPQNHRPNYVVGDGNSVVVPGKELHSRPERGRDTLLHPFPQNLHCQTASVIDREMKERIFQAVVENGVLAQKVAQDYKIKLSRVEAIVRLQQVEKTWTNNVCYYFPDVMIQI